MVKRDGLYIIVIIFALVACYLTLNSTGEKVQEAYDNCDEFINEWCTCGKNLMNQNYSLPNIDVGGGLNEIYDYNKDGEGSG